MKRLKSLYVNHFDTYLINNKSFLHLHNLKYLSIRYCLFNNKISNKAFVNLKKLKYLEIHDCNYVNDVIFKYLNELEILSAKQCPGISKFMIHAYQ